MDRRRQDDGRERSSRSYKTDPANSRLFIMCSRATTELQLEDAFRPFGNIEDIWITKDRRTHESKGIAYIKFAKTSEAAAALEEMNGKTLVDEDRPLKVLIASSREEGSRGKEENEEERALRLFILIPRTMTESEITEDFSAFGELESVSIVRDKKTNENKGFAFVKYYRPTHAAKAYENCSRSYRPVFAEPKHGSRSSGPLPEYKRPRDRNEDRHRGLPSSSFSRSGPVMNVSANRPARIIVSAASELTQDQMWRLADLVPGMDYCERKPSGGDFNHGGYPVASDNLFVIQYKSLDSATHAKERLHGFEYPTGSRLIAMFEAGEASTRSNPDILQLTETIANATALLKAAGYSGKIQEPFSSPVLCSAKLPAPQPLAQPNSEIVETLFIVCTPYPPPLPSLTDVFSRFGNLVEVFLLRNKNIGFAKFSSKESAHEALEVLNGQQIEGNTLKVQLAEPEGESERKRRKVDDDRSDRIM